MANQDAKRNIIQAQYYSLLDQMAESGDKAGINKILSSPGFQKLRIAAGFGKRAAVLGGDSIVAGAGHLGGDILSTVSQVSAAALLGLNAPQSGKNTAMMQKQAYQRKLNALAGSGTGFGDVKASAGNISSNIMQLGKAGFFANSLINPSSHALSGFMSPGMAAAKTFGGVGALGSTTASGLGSVAGMLGLGSGATSAIAAANPVMMGMLAMMAATKGGKALYNYTQKDSSTNVTIDRRMMITRGTSPHELEHDYGNTDTLRMQIVRLQNMGQLKPSESLIANILAMIEGHTSVLPYIAAEAVDRESRKNKEGGAAGHNILNEKFGDNGDIIPVDGNLKKQSLLSRIFTSLELGTSNLANTFDPRTYLSAIFQGKSVTEMYNAANSKEKGVDALKSEEQFAAKTGTSTSLVQAIHTTPSQIMAKADTFEAKQLSVLGLISEINRFSAHELLKIRMDGFGITNSSTHGLLAQIRDLNFAKDAADQSYFEDLLTFADNKLGYIPGYNVLSGTVKMAKSGSDWMKDMFLGDRTGEKDENGNDIRKKNRSISKVFTDWLTNDVKNDLLDSENQLRSEVGAVELGPQELMANYLGKAYPDRFELLLKYNLSQMESLQALAGPIKRSKLETLSMNKYDGKFAGQAYHNAKDMDIRKRMEEQMNFLNDSSSMLSEWYKSSNRDKIIQSQLENASENNPFLKEFLASNGESIKSNKGLGRAGKKQLSAEDLQEAQKNKENAEHKMSLAEQQVNILQDIRDCLNCKGEDYKLRNKNAREEAADSGSDFDWFGDSSSRNRNRNRNKHKPKYKPKKLTKAKNILNTIKKFFSLKSLKKMMAGGVLFAGLEGLVQIVPVIGEILLNPMVLTAVGVAAAGYGLYELGSWAHDKLFGKDGKDSGAKAGDKLSSIVKNNASNRIHRIDAIADAIKESNRNEKTLKEFSEKQFGHIKDIDKLRYMLSESDNPFTRAAIRLRIIELGGKVTSVSKVVGWIDSDYIESNGLYGSDNNRWKPGALEAISHMSFSTLQKFEETEFDNTSKSMKKDLAKIEKHTVSAMNYKINNHEDAARFKNPNFPFLNRVTSNFGVMRKLKNSKKYTRHMGIDFGATPPNTHMKLTAVAAGKVLRTTRDDGTGTGQGNAIFIQTDEGDTYCYWHLQSEPDFKPGDRVKRGQQVGIMGKSGGSTGIHLHLGLYKKGVTWGRGQFRDPSEWLLRQIKAPLNSTNDEVVNAHGDNEFESDSKPIIDHKDIVDPSANGGTNSSKTTDNTSITKTKIENFRNNFNKHTSDILRDNTVNKSDLKSLLTQQHLLIQQINGTQNDENKKILEQHLMMLGLIVKTLRENKTRVVTLNGHNENLDDMYTEIITPNPTNHKL